MSKLMERLSDFSAGNARKYFCSEKAKKKLLPDAQEIYNQYFLPKLETPSSQSYFLLTFISELLPI